MSTVAETSFSGFVLLVSEVRRLVQGSAAAAREIKGLIGSSVEKVDDGSGLVREASAAMADTVSQGGCACATSTSTGQMPATTAGITLG